MADVRLFPLELDPREQLAKMGRRGWVWEVCFVFVSQPDGLVERLARLRR